jgi:hypothetical protein
MPPALALATATPVAAALSTTKRLKIKSQLMLLSDVYNIFRFAVSYLA